MRLLKPPSLSAEGGHVRAVCGKTHYRPILARDIGVGKNTDMLTERLDDVLGVEEGAGIGREDRIDNEGAKLLVKAYANRMDKGLKLHKLGLLASLGLLLNGYAVRSKERVTLLCKRCIGSVTMVILYESHLSSVGLVSV